MCFVWIWEQTDIISLYSINWLVCITETVCLLRGTDWVFMYNSDYSSWLSALNSKAVNMKMSIMQLKVQ